MRYDEYDSEDDDAQLQLTPRRGLLSANTPDPAAMSSVPQRISAPTLAPPEIQYATAPTIASAHVPQPARPPALAAPALAQPAALAPAQPVAIPQPAQLPALAAPTISRPSSAVQLSPATVAQPAHVSSVPELSIPEPPPVTNIADVSPPGHGTAPELQAHEPLDAQSPASDFNKQLQANAKLTQQQLQHIVESVRRFSSVVARTWTPPTIAERPLRA